MAANPRFCCLHASSSFKLASFYFQMAYWRLNKESAATYESCSTSAFKKGRTETVRPLTMETNHACQLFDKSDASPDELYAAMSECTKVHNQLTKEAAMGEFPSENNHATVMLQFTHSKGQCLNYFHTESLEFV